MYIYSSTPEFEPLFAILFVYVSFRVVDRVGYHHTKLFLRQFLHLAFEAEQGQVAGGRGPLSSVS